MAIRSGLKKLFKKRKAFSPPSEYTLNSLELESVIVFFATLLIFLISIISLFLIQ